MKISQALSGYWLDKRLDFSPATVQNYGYVFRRFLEFLGDVEMERITADDVRRYFDYLRTERELSKRSIHTHWAVLSSLWTWAEKELGMAHILRGRVQSPDYRKRVIEPLTLAELRKLVKVTELTRPWVTAGGAEVQSERPTGLRDRAIVLTLADTGLRASELCALTVGDYEEDRGRFHVRHGKGDKARFVVAGSRTRKALWRYLATRARAKASDPLFATKDGRIMRRDNLYHMLVRLGENAGVSNVHPHRFRHTFAIQFLRNGGNVLMLKELLGHQKLDMVLQYVQIAERDIDESAMHSPADNWRL